MRLNQVTVTMPDLNEGWDFYRALGLRPIVDSRPYYVRFLCPDGDSTFSLHQGQATSGGTTVYFECEDVDATFEQLKAKGIAFSHPPQDKSFYGGRRNYSIQRAIACCCILLVKTVSIRLGGSMRPSMLTVQPERGQRYDHTSLLATGS